MPIDVFLINFASLLDACAVLNLHNSRDYVVLLAISDRTDPRKEVKDLSGLICTILAESRLGVPMF
jgi:hypothetical protein